METREKLKKRLIKTKNQFDIEKLRAKSNRYAELKLDKGKTNGSNWRERMNNGKNYSTNAQTNELNDIFLNFLR